MSPSNRYQSYIKQPLNIQQQIELLVKRNLLIDDYTLAAQVLSTVGYYRLSAYFKAFEITSLDLHHQFQPNVTFNHLWDCYQFDRLLRLHTQDAIERIEVAIRARLSDHMSLKYGINWYVNDSCFNPVWKNPSKYQRKTPRDYFFHDLEDICQNRKNEEHINHFYQYYHSPDYPPSWMLMESLSFGSVINLINYLANKQDKRAIAETFQLHTKVFMGMLQALRYVRNLCAHHARLWNRWLVLEFVRPKRWSAHAIPSRTYYELAWLLWTLLKVIAPKTAWKEKLFTLFDHYPMVPFYRMGFPADWEAAVFWSDTTHA